MNKKASLKKKKQTTHLLKGKKRVMLGQEEQTGTTLENQDRLYKETN